MPRSTWNACLAFCSLSCYKFCGGVKSNDRKLLFFGREVALIVANCGSVYHQRASTAYKGKYHCDPSGRDDTAFCAIGAGFVRFGTFIDVDLCLSPPHDAFCHGE